MNETSSSSRPSLAKRLLHRIFPVAPDFYALLNDQCNLAVETTSRLVDFMECGDMEIALEIRKLEHEGDALKARNLDLLNKSFATVIDRDDLDRAIRSIDDILNYAKTTVREVEALHVTPDAPMAEMARRLHEGTEALRRGYRLLGGDPEKAEAEAAAARKAERKTEQIYRRALSALFDDDRLVKIVTDAGPDGSLAAMREVVKMFRRREVYRHLSNAADRLATAGDHLHDSIVKSI